MCALDLQQLQKLHKPVPRYTSYPTAVDWEMLSEDTYKEKLQSFSKTKKPLSLYFHIPFCKTMCLYCACSVVLNRKEENEERYVDYLCKEIDRVTDYIGKKREVTQIHFGGGTPTKLSIPLLKRLFDKITDTFAVDFSKEVAIEIDPRTVLENDGEKLRFFRELGFNRISLGVQDTDPKVQEAVKRRQSYEMTKKTYDLSRTLGFEKINIDLIYGLPYQTLQTFRKTIEDILAMQPDRIALFSYAKVPWLKPHQKAIREETLPSFNEKFLIYNLARKRFVENGYVSIGMDHFALTDDEIAESYRNKTLIRNFQGYSLPLAEDILSFGITAIGFMQNTYVQNIKKLESYYETLDQGKLPVCNGKVLTKEDLLRKWVIHTLMCTFELDKNIFFQKFGKDFDTHFASKQKSLAELEKEGLIIKTPHKIFATELGELFIRVIASTFDAYFGKHEKKPKFSQSI